MTLLDTFTIRVKKYVSMIDTVVAQEMLTSSVKLLGRCFQFSNRGHVLFDSHGIWTALDYIDPLLKSI